MKKPLEQAELFLKKAAEDEALLDIGLVSAQVSDGIFGFHAQQAAEKLLKALLSSKQIRLSELPLDRPQIRLLLKKLRSWVETTIGK